MKTILLILTISVVVFTIMNLLFLLGITAAPKPTADCDCYGDDDDVPTKPLKEGLMLALHTYNIKHQAESIADEVLEENPKETDLVPLIGQALKKVRARNLENKL